MTTGRQSFIQLLIFCAIVTAARSASADWQLTPFIGLTFLGNTTLVDLEKASGRVHRNFGGAMTAIGRGPLGAEAYFVYTPGFLDHGDLKLVNSSRSFALMGNLVLAAPLKWNEYGLRPFVSGGLGLLHVATDKNDKLPFSRNLLAYDFGGGAVGFLSDRTGLRFDLRYVANLRKTDDPTAVDGKVRLKYWTAAVGLVLKR